jgi:hypothetical protein
MSRYFHSHPFGRSTSYHVSYCRPSEVMEYFCGNFDNFLFTFFVSNLSGVSSPPLAARKVKIFHLIPRCLRRGSSFAHHKRLSVVCRHSPSESPSLQYPYFSPTTKCTPPVNGVFGRYGYCGAIEFHLRMYRHCQWGIIT